MAGSDSRCRGVYVLSESQTPLPSVQVLRGFAAILVAFGHILVEMPDLRGGPAHRIAPELSHFHFGVDVFFVISGFIMVYTTVGQTPSLATGARFLGARFLRISPLYWILTLSAAGLALVLGDAFNHSRPDLPRLLTSLLYVPYRNEDGDMFPILGPGWTLNYEMMFYVVFAIGLIFRGWRGLWPTIVVLVGIVVLGWTIAPMQPQLSFWTKPILFEFVYGMLLGAYFVRPKLSESVPARLPEALLILGLIGFVMLHVFGYVRSDSRFIFYGVPAAMLVVGAVLGDGQKRLPRFRFGEILGDASYSIYLTHPFVLRALRVLWNKLPFQLPIAIYVIVALVLVVATGVLVARAVEIPVHRRTRMWIRRTGAGGPMTVS